MQHTDPTVTANLNTLGLTARPVTEVECCGKHSTFEGHSVGPLYCPACSQRAWQSKRIEVQYPAHVWLVKPASLAGYLASQVAKKAA